VSGRPEERADVPSVEGLRRQLRYLAERSPFYRKRVESLPHRLRRIEDLRAVAYTTKDELRAGQERDPPFGPHLCAPREALVRVHVTSGTTGTPVAIGFTRADHERNSAVGGAAFRVAGLRRDDVVAHCLNYALYAGGIADHMALETSGATVVPVGVGQSLRLLEIIPRLGINALFGTLSYPSHLARHARELGIRPHDLGLRLIVTAGEPGAGLRAVRAEIEEAWGAPAADTFGMSDVWSTMAGECGQGQGLHLSTHGAALVELCDPDSGEPVDIEDGATGELVWTHLGREASPLLRYPSRHAAGLRAQDPARVPLDGRGGAPAGSRGSARPKGARGMNVDTAARGSARVLSWDRQPRRNAWTRALIEELANAIESAGDEADARCIVVRGVGEHFSAGDDLFDALEADAGEWQRTVEAFQRLTRATIAAPVPVLAAIDGVCIGGALEFAASCDMRVCTDRARFGTPEVRIGLVATNAGTLLLPELLGETAARELLLTGEIFDAGWARMTGFVSEVIPAAELDERLSKLAAAFEATSRDAVAATKRMLNERLGDLLEAALTREEGECIRLFGGDDARDALEAFAARGRAAPRPAGGARPR
jgi:enoyl-CoA hydratase/carnithine racemase/phenylacetate-coenzyme A ligase PaaK-like adenylate-forming protein